ncbi:MAG: T9SS type A sorting domain-containing protein [Bacteroidota bacterium]|nr:T9SS type A sorting domain-containing protein [Bacteroidota bacterium]
MNNFLKIFLFSLFFFLLNSLQLHSLFPQLISDFKVNDDLTSYPHFRPKVGADDSGNFILVWQDERFTTSTIFNKTIFCQRYNKQGLPLGVNFRLTKNLDTASTPDISVKDNGSFIICWTDRSNSEISVRLFDSNADPVSPKITVSESNFSNTIPAISSDQKGNFVIAWENYSDTTGDGVYYQRFDSIGTKIEHNENVSDQAQVSRKRYPDIVSKRDGSFIICWQDNRLDGIEYDIYMQMFNSIGERIGNNTLVNEEIFITQEAPKISSDSSGNFCITWNDQRFFASTFCQFYDRNGQKLGNNILVSNNELPTVISSKPNGDIAIGMGRGLPSNMQRIRNDRTLIGSSFSISNQAPSSWKIQSGLTIRNNRIINAWQDNRNGHFDIYCNVLSYSNPDSTVSINNLSSEIPDQFKLWQNYPNPFNPKTKIAFQILKPALVIVKVYNILGKEIENLVNKKLSAGKYEVEFSSKDLSSGTYYYKMITENYSETKKMTIIK